MIQFESIEALLFDCDGTLADSMPLHDQAWIETFALFGRQITVDDLLPFAGTPTPIIARHLIQAFHLDLEPETLIQERERRADALLEKVKPIEAVLTFVHQHHGHKPMAVISGGSHAHVEKTLSCLDIRNYFSLLLTADSPYPPKPAPDLFLAAASTFGVTPSNCIVFEDADLGIAGARAAGMHVLDVRTLPGYPRSKAALMA